MAEATTAGPGGPAAPCGPRAVPPGAPPEVRSTTRDGASRVTGRFRFAVDRYVTGTAHAVAVRSAVPHGELTGIGVTEAERVPGVLGVLTGQALARDPSLHLYHGESRADQPVLAIDRVRYVGEPVAVVVADTRAAAEEAAGRVVVDVTPWPSVTDHDEAGLPGAPQLHEQWPDNECGRWTLRHGDAERALAAAAYRHTGVYRSPSASHAAMEPHCATAAWLPDGSVEVWSATQSVYPVRNRLAGVLGLPKDKVRVRADNLGGAFGGKLDLRLEGLVALAARMAGRPVRMELRRDEVFVTAAKHAATVTVTTGVDAGGLLVARIIGIVWNAGAYAITTPRGSRTGLIRSPGPYRIPHVLGRSVARYTNTVPTGPFRGAMSGQICWAHESAMDEVAAGIGLDPVEFRRRNLLRTGDVYATGEAMHDMHYDELLAAAAAGVGAGVGVGASDGVGAAEPPRGPRRRGRGVALVMKTTRTPSRSEAIVTLGQDGAVTVRASAGEMGQGAAASLAELAGRRLGIEAGRVAVSVADTATTPFDTTSSSSRTTFALGTSVERACEDLLTRLAAIAARDPELGPAEPGQAPAGGAGTGPSWKELLVTAGIDSLSGHGGYASPPGAGKLDPDTLQGAASDHWHQGAVGVEVEVDTETGKVEVLRMHGASYGGRVVDQLRARKQTTGGMVFGLGQALMEDLCYDAGQPAATTLSDYQIPSFLDVPPVIGATILASPDPEAEPHGMGENTVPPMAPALGNAIFDATGARVRDLPVTPERVLRALFEQSGREPSAKASP
ncbi:MAG TPA: xanthine dehydrogenase family protein molybdopterin-binding subunit [Trebonia sp.]